MYIGLEATLRTSVRIFGAKGEDFKAAIADMPGWLPGGDADMGGGRRP